MRRLVLAATGPGLGGRTRVTARAARARHTAPLPPAGLLPADRRTGLRRPGPHRSRTCCCVARPAASSSRPSMRGYLGQLYAIAGWTSLPWLHGLRQPTLVIAGDDDPIVPSTNGRILSPVHPGRPAARARRRPPVPARTPVGDGDTGRGFRRRDRRPIPLRALCADHMLVCGAQAAPPICARGPMGAEPAMSTVRGMAEAVIVAAARSPIGRAFKGNLRDMRPDDLAATIVRAALDQVPQLDPAAIDDLLLGCGQPGGESGFNMARVVAVRLGCDQLPAPRSPATVRRHCRPRWRCTRSGPARATCSSPPGSRR